MSVMSRGDVVTLVGGSCQRTLNASQKLAGTLTLVFSSSVGYLNLSLILAQGKNV